LIWLDLWRRQNAKLNALRVLRVQLSMPNVAPLSSLYRAADKSVATNVVRNIGMLAGNRLSSMG
jgi:hypothetical protein